ncbi:MAG: RluA family pseudouridine synthase [Anaeroplasma sp.]
MRRFNENKKNINEYTAVFKVNRSDELLTFLLSKCNTSRNNVKALLSNRQIVVNGNVVTQYNYIIAKDDEIKILKHPNKALPTFKVKKDNLKRYKLNIIYEDKDFIAIDKPTGLLSVESDKDDECAYKYLNDYLQSKNPSSRAFQLHRIDKDTSGVLIFTKNVKLHSMLKLNWNDYVLTREYYAVVEGNLEKKAGIIESNLLKSENNLMYSAKGHDGVKAITNYSVVLENKLYSLLRVQIATGRKNQIRVHMKDINHPIVGDEKYGSGNNPINRLGLHASKLEIIHPITKEILVFEAPIPGVFKGLFGRK